MNRNYWHTCKTVPFPLCPFLLAFPYLPKTMKNTFTACGLFLLILCLLVGCRDGSKLKGLVPCAGTVMWKGEPVGGASLAFVPKDPDQNLRVAATQTDAQGKFVVTTLTPQDGIMPGEYIVSVGKWEYYGPELPPTMGRDGFIVQHVRPQRNILPPQYESLTNPKIVVTIPQKGNKNLEFVLDE